MRVYFKENIETSLLCFKDATGVTSLHFNTRISLSTCFSTNSASPFPLDYSEAGRTSFRKFLAGGIPVPRNCPHSRERIYIRLYNRGPSSVSLERYADA